MKVIYQEKDSPNSVGEFEILDREQLEKLSKHINEYLETSDKDFRLPENPNQTQSPNPNKNFKPINPYPGHNSMNPTNINHPNVPNQHPFYQEGGIPVPNNIGYPPSKQPTYNSQGVIKIPYYTNQIPQLYYKKLKFCTYRHTYIWLHNGKSFWCYPTYISDTTLSGWKWQNYKWKFFSIPTSRISNFYCYR
ncbi:MAG: hypothetical protein ACRCWM_00335 [Sarcina sp.]